MKTVLIINYLILIKECVIVIYKVVCLRKIIISLVLFAILLGTTSELFF